MRSDLFDELKNATAGEYELLGELDGDRDWMAYLARSLAGGSLAVLMLERAGGGAFELREFPELDAALPIGRTRCDGCGTEMDGWPRACGGCGRDLEGLAPEAAFPGRSGEELLEEVRAAATDEYEVFGAMRPVNGGGAMYFARERASGRIVGLVLRQSEEGSDLLLDVSWSRDEAALARPELAEPEPAPEPEPEPEPEHGSPVLPPPRRRRRLYAVAGAAVASVAVLALFLSGQGATSTGGVAQAGDSLRPAPPTPTPAPVHVPPIVPPTVDSSSSALPEKPVVDSSRIAPVRPPVRRPRKVRTDSVLPAQPAPDSALVEERRLRAEADRRRVVAAVERYAAAVQSRRLEEIQRQYPGISESGLKGWRDFFRHRLEEILRVTPEIQGEPSIDGDVATVSFRLHLDHSGDKFIRAYDAILDRSGDGWAIRSLTGR